MNTHCGDRVWHQQWQQFSMPMHFDRLDTYVYAKIVYPASPYPNQNPATYSLVTLDIIFANFQCIFPANNLLEFDDFPFYSSFFDIFVTIFSFLFFDFRFSGCQKEEWKVRKIKHS